MPSALVDKARARERRPLLGLRRAPGRLALRVFRLPLRLYRRDRGWMLGRTFLVFEHVGRRTGLRHQSVAMVLDDDPATGELIVCSAWGPDADWVRNLRAGPATEVQIGRQRFTPVHRFLPEEAAVAVGMRFRARHPLRARVLSWLLGWGDLGSEDAVREFVRLHPFVGFRPTPSTRTGRPSVE